MEEDRNEEIQSFMNRNIDSLRYTFNVSYYDKIIDFNRYLISLIAYMVSGHIFSILINVNYYNILSKTNTATVTLKNGKIVIYNFQTMFSTNDNDELIKSIHHFGANIYYHDKIILDTMFTILYYDDKGISDLIFDSKILYDELYIDNYRDVFEISDKLDDLISIGSNKNDLLETMIKYLEEILDPKEVPTIINRPVFLFNEGDNEEDEEE